MILTKEQTFMMPVTLVDRETDSGLCKKTIMLEFSNLELLHAALTCTMPAGRLTPAYREKRKAELLLKLSMIENALDTRGDQLIKSQRTMYLDASEKGAIAHYLGMIFTKLLAGKLYQVDYIAAVSQIDQPELAEIGKYGKKYRYDLIGLQKGAASYSVWEAVGRSENSQLAFGSACREAAGVELIGSGVPLHRCAVMNYYERGFYTAVLRETEGAAKGVSFSFTREAYLRAYYQPLMELFTAEHPEILYQEGDGLREIEIPLPQLTMETHGSRRLLAGISGQLAELLKQGKYGMAEEGHCAEPQGEAGWYAGRDGISVAT